MSDKKLTKSQIKKLNARKSYEVDGLSIDEIVAMYGYTKGTVKGYVSKEGWQKQPRKDLQDTANKAMTHLSMLTGENLEELKENLFGGSGDKTDTNEVNEIETLATVMMAVARGSVSMVKQTFIEKDGEFKEKYREVQPIRPDARCGLFYLELSEKLASMVDIGVFETEQEKEKRFKGYQERKKKEREEFANRALDE